MTANPKHTGIEGRVRGYGLVGVIFAVLGILTALGYPDPMLRGATLGGSVCILLFAGFASLAAQMAADLRGIRAALQEIASPQKSKSNLPVGERSELERQDQ